MVRFLSVAKVIVALAVVATLNVVRPPGALADPPFLGGAIGEAQVCPTIIEPGDHVTATWRFNNDMKDRIYTIEVWFAHSTGMGHAPQVPVRAAIDPTSSRVDFVAPSLSLSGPGDIWSVDLVWRDGDHLTELALIPVTVR